MFIRSHRYQLLVSLLTVALIPVCFLIGYQSWLLKGEMRKAADHQRVSTQQIADQIETFVEMHRRTIEAAAKQVTTSGERSKDKFDAILSAMYHQFPGFINMYFADKHAKTLAFYPEFNAKGESMVGADFSFRDHYKKLLNEPKTYISHVLKGIGGTDKLLCTIVSPYFDADGRFDGFVLGALDLEKIGTIVARAGLEKNTYAVVTDERGHAILSPGWSATSHPVALDIESIATSHPMPGQTRLLRHTSAITNVPVVTTATKLFSPPWYVWISVPESVEEAIFHQWLISSAALVFAVILLVALISNAISGKLASAVEALGIKAGLLQHHEYEQSRAVKLAPQAPAEIQKLAQTFESMAYSIETARTELLTANALLDTRVKERTATLAATIDSMRDGFGLLDRNGSFLFSNRRLRKFISDLGLNINEPLTRESFVRTVRRIAAKSGESAVRLLSEPNYVFEFEESDNKVWLLTSFAVKDGSHMIGMGIVVRDITEPHKLDVMKNSLISVAAHEFKTPLASLRMQAETLARKDAAWTKELQSELIAGLVEDIERLQTLVHDWLDLSRIEAGSIVLRRRLIKTDIVIEDARRAAASYAKFECQIESDAHTVTADPDRLRQILINLFANAVRYCDRDPEISVHVSRCGSQVRFDVKDNGIGIAPESQEKIFEKFHQVDMSMTRRAGGTGLGLTISRGLARAHGGNITVTSKPGVGSTFTVTIEDQS